MSRDGGNTGAVFDLDGTLIRGTSAERLFVPWLSRCGLLGVRQWAAFLPVALLLPVVGRTIALRRNKRYLRGLRVEEVRAATTEFVSNLLEAHACVPAVAELEKWRGEGKPVFLLTGAPDFLAEAIGQRLGVTEARGTRLEIRDNRFTGRLDGPHWFGKEKVTGVEEIRRDHDLDLARSAGFADHVHDIPFLECFGRPVAVDPAPGLARHAEQAGWKILRCADLPDRGPSLASPRQTADREQRLQRPGLC